jgi:predicted dehydrogenase
VSAVDISPDLQRGAGLARAQPDMRLPRLGFAGVGWIGRLRMQALADSGLATIAALADPSADALQACREHAPDAVCSDRFEALLEQDLDGIVIATPSAAHAAQATAALERGIAVFCQKPLARTASEAAAVVAAAQRADRLLATDFSYRCVDGMAELRKRIGAGELGEVFAIDLHFHNAYGPDKDWFYDLAQAGGGCVLDLGIHLVDLAQWLCDGTAARELHDLDAHLFAGGRRLPTPLQQVEDYASVQWRRGDGVLVRLACSWRLQAGCDAMIGAGIYGTAGGAQWSNVGGSFFDFNLDLLHGTTRERIAAPPDEWGGRALLDWTRRLAAGEGFDPGVRDVVDVARTVDAIYGR